MSVKIKLAAELRNDTGKGASRRLRHQGKVPAIMYGADKQPTMLAIAHKDIFHAAENEAFYSTILAVEYDGISEQVILKDMQRHPARVEFMHLDFQRIDEAHALHINVPLHFMNEESSPGVKAGGSVAHLMTELEISCLPKDLPEYIEIDVGGLDLGDSIYLSAIQPPEGVSIVELTRGEDAIDHPVVNIHIIRAEIEPEEEGVEEEQSDEEDESGEEA